MLTTLWQCRRYCVLHIRLDTERQSRYVAYWLNYNVRSVHDPQRCYNYHSGLGATLDSWTDICLIRSCLQYSATLEKDLDKTVEDYVTILAGHSATPLTTRVLLLLDWRNLKILDDGASPTSSSSSFRGSGWLAPKMSLVKERTGYRYKVIISSCLSEIRNLYHPEVRHAV